MNQKKEKCLTNDISRREFVVATAVTGVGLTVFGCKKPKAPEPSPTPNPPATNNVLKIINFSIPNKVTFAVGAEFSFLGNGYAAGDKLLFSSTTDPSKTITIDLKTVTANNCSIIIPAEFIAGTYRITVLRGNQSQVLGTSIIEMPINNVPDVPGKNIKGTVVAGGVGLANVVVSDGQEVTKTDQNGIYYLTSKKAKSFVFISIPGGYEVATSNNILPLFYKPHTAAVGVVETIDFELTAVNNDKHVVLALGDMHLANRNNDITQFQTGFLADGGKTVSKYKSEGYKVYGIALGDMTWDAYWYSNKYSFTQYLDLMKTIKIPVFHTIGNHDNDPYISDDWQSENSFRTTLGPTYYSFNLGKVHYIVLDNVEYLNNNGSQNTIGERNYNGVIVADQMAWLKKDLAMITDKTTPVVIAMHIQLNNSPSVTNTASLRLNNATEFINTLSGFTDVNILTGHTHAVYAHENNDNLMEHNSGALCATWWWTGRSGYAGNHICKDGAPGGYGIWKFNNRNYDWLYKSIGYEENYQFRAYDLNRVHITASKYAPSATEAALKPYKGPYENPSSANEILVNVWGFDKKWKVEILENDMPLNVTRVNTLDPLHIISYEAFRVNAGAEPTADFNTGYSTHFFKAKAAGATSPILIRVTDRFGNVYTEKMERPKDLIVTMQ